MTHCWGIMILTDKLSPLGGFGCDYLAVVFPPFPLDFDQIVGIYPRFEGSFVLWWKCRKGSDKEVFGEDDNVSIVPVSLIVVGSSRQSISAAIGLP